MVSSLRHSVIDRRIFVSLFLLLRRRETAEVVEINVGFSFGVVFGRGCASGLELFAHRRMNLIQSAFAVVIALRLLGIHAQLVVLDRRV